MTATPEPTLSTDAAETAESAAPENVGGLSGHELLSRTAVVVVSYDSAALLERTLPKNSFQVKKWDRKTYGIGAQILAGLGVQKMRVMGKPSSMNGLNGFGLQVTGFEEAE